MARVSAKNVPEEIKLRLIGVAEREMVSESAVVRKLLNEALPPLDEVKKFTPKRHKSVLSVTER